MKRRNGFTLVEVMLVVAIVGILVAISVPVSLRARHDANERVAISSMKTIVNALESYRATQVPATYPPNLATLTSAGGSNPPYIVNQLDTQTTGRPRQGYLFVYTFLNNDQYTLVASPSLPGRTGTRIFFVDETAVIRLNNANGISVE